MVDLIPAKIRELPTGSTLSNAGMEIGQGNLAGAASKQVPARLAEVISRSYLLSRTITAPPGSPAEGDRYFVPDGATGAWSGADGLIAEWLLIPNNAGASVGGWFFTAALGVNFIEAEGIIISFAVGGPVTPVIAQKLRNVVGNTTILATDGVVTIDATAAARTVIMPRALGAATITKTVTIERALADNSATPNTITITDDLGAFVGMIVSPISAAGAQVPWLDIRSNGTNVTCKGVP